MEHGSGPVLSLAVHVWRTVLKILIVDDDPGTLNAIKVSMLSEGHEADTAEDGVTALQIMESASRTGEAIHLLLTDLRMPGISGLDLIRAARANNPGMCVVLMTDYGDEDLRKKVLTLGRCGYLEKPFSPEKLHGAIEEIWREVSDG
jgi:DNA-binding response OmpR family regulator